MRAGVPCHDDCAAFPEQRNKDRAVAFSRTADVCTMQQSHMGGRGMDQAHPAGGRSGGRPRASKKKTQPLERTLAILIQSMRGNKVVVEMKNDTEISGVLEETDQNMNLSMVDVRQTNPDGSVKKMNIVLVQGKMIRYVHIPDEVDAIRNLQDHMRTMDQQGYRRQMLKAKPSQAPP